MTDIHCFGRRFPLRRKTPKEFSHYREVMVFLKSRQVFSIIDMTLMPCKTSNTYLLLRALLKVIFVFSTHWSWGFFCLENQTKKAQTSLREASICCLCFMGICHQDHLPPKCGWFEATCDVCGFKALSSFQESIFLLVSEQPPGNSCGSYNPFLNILL